MHIYAHIPFCASRCIYCDFTIVLEKYKEKHGGETAYLKALVEETTQRFTSLNNPTPIQTLYFGGGTPSLCSANFYQHYLSHLTSIITLDTTIEITLEANPNAMADKPNAYLKAGINRLSIGVQSFQDNELKKLSRIHTAAEAKQCITQCQDAGFNNISIDLMYALPEQTLASWQDTLNQAIETNVQHISLYGLKVEDGTPLEKLSKLAPYKLPDEDTNTDMYHLANDVLSKAGYHRYEFSNFAKPGYESRHNLCYWDNKPFMALGVSAHGYLNDSRYETVKDLGAYLNNPLAGNTHHVNLEEALENALIFGLRKSEGVDISEIESTYGINFLATYGHILKKFEEDDVFILENGRLKLTQAAIPISNHILCEFIND